MARIRTIKPDFWVDEKVVELSAYARLLFIGLWNFADDDGRMVYSPKKIKMQIFPSDNLDILAVFDEIRRDSMITIYAVDNTEYLQVNQFHKHQKIDKRTPSKLPPPPNNTESPIDSPTPPDGMEGIKEGNGMDQGNKTPLASNEKISFSADGHWENISHAQRTAWERAYPALSLDAELARAASWILANPKNRKKNYARYLTNWLSRAQDTAPRVVGKPGKLASVVNALERMSGPKTESSH